VALKDWILVATVAVVSPGLCATVNGSPGNRVVKPQKTLSGKPDTTALTSAECVGLGGKVVFSYGCDSRYLCYTTDGDGVVRKVCTTAKK
jgi:hypothetical protein